MDIKHSAIGSRAWLTAIGRPTGVTGAPAGCLYNRETGTLSARALDQPGDISDRGAGVVSLHQDGSRTESRLIKRMTDPTQ
jgi:hypothetical protein